MTNRTWPLILTAFAVVLLLIAVSSLTIIRKTNTIYEGLAANQDRYRQNRRALEEIRAGLYLASINIRDYLLETSRLDSEEYRAELFEIRTGVQEQLEQLEEITRSDDRHILENLEREIDAFWAALDPVFKWTPSEKLQRSIWFLRRDLADRRAAVFSIAQEIARLNSGNIARQDQLSQQAKVELEESMMRMMLAGSILAFLIMGATVWRVAKLERRAELQQRKTKSAELAMRELSHRLVNAQEEERRNLSRELHDEVGQILTALRLEITNLEQLRHQNGETFEEHAAEAKRLAEQSLRSVRDMAMGLRPSMLDDIGLAPAIEWQARDFSRRMGIPVATQIEGDFSSLTDSHRTGLYRAVQEALTNCARHARASNIRILLHGGADRVSLTIQDDGVGIVGRASDRRGLGLLGMEERVRELGGTTAIQTQPGRGTLLLIDIPLKQEVSA